MVAVIFPAGASQSNEFTYNSLIELINANDVKSIETLTHFLPAEMQRNITFRLRPHNKLQEGVRAVRFTADGRLALTHSDDPNVKGGNSVEVVETKSNGYQTLHVIDFDPTGKTRPIFAASNLLREHPNSGESCAACHGDHPRKIWPSYNFWPDACGEDDDTVDEKCLSFLKRARTNPRFADLAWDPADPAWPYLKNRRERSLARMPNTRFSYLTEIHNARQNANLIESSLLFNKLKYTLAYESICERTATEATRLNSILARSPDVPIPEAYAGNRRAYINSISASGRTVIARSYYNDVSGVQTSLEPSRSQMLYEVMGITLGNVGANDELRQNGVTRIGLDENLLNHASDNYVATQILRDMSKDDSTIAEAVKNANGDSYLADPSTAYFYNAEPRFNAELAGVFMKIRPLKDLCFYLYRKSQSELDRMERALNLRQDCLPGSWPGPLPSASMLSAFTVAKSANELVLEQGRKLLSSANCISCHDGTKSRHLPGPRITFSNLDAFAADDRRWQNENFESIASAAKETMKAGIHGTRMPMNRPALSADDQKAIVAYLEYMAADGDPNKSDHASQPLRRSEGN